MAHAGEIQLVIGGMFSGKTSELLRRIRRYMVAKKTCAVIKYSKDIRYSPMASTHDKVEHVAYSLDSLEQSDDIFYAHDVIGIDEGQFFNNIIDVCEKWANKGKIIIVAALDATFERKPFGKICELVAKCENVIKLTAICNCGAEAPFTHRIVAGNEVEMIGGSDIYVALCRKCYNEKK